MGRLGDARVIKRFQFAASGDGAQMSLISDMNIPEYEWFETSITVNTFPC